jgi:hypothetical protein
MPEFSGTIKREFMLKNIFQTLPKPALSLSTRPSREQGSGHASFAAASIGRLAPAAFSMTRPCTWDEENPARRPLRPSKKVRIRQ